MLLQRKFTQTAEQIAAMQAAGQHIPADHVLVKHTGLQAAQNFSRRLILQAVTDGWATIERNRLTMRTAADQDDLVFTIKRDPGYYCKSTGERMPISQLAWEQLLAERVGKLAYAEAQAWLKGAGKAADDYEITMAYECELAAEQHEKYRAVEIKPGIAVAAHTLEA